MIPKVVIKYDKKFAEEKFKEFHPNKDFEPVWKRIKILGKNFEPIFEKYITPILKLISKYSGFDWEEYVKDEINVYPVIRVPSYSHPLRLHLREDLVLTLGILIHELAHNNMSFKFPSREIQENVMSEVALAVLQDLNLETKESKKFFDMIYQNRFKTSRPALPFDLEKKTVKEYLRT